MGGKSKKQAASRKKGSAKITAKSPVHVPAGSSPPASKAGATAGIRSTQRRENLQRMLLAKRQEILNEIKGSIGQSLTEEQQRRLEAARDVGDQALMDLQRELGISLLEMRNRKRQSIDDALARLAEGLYGICAECGIEISEKRLAAVPFAKLCVECQTKQELLEKI